MQIEFKIIATEHNTFMPGCFNHDLGKEIRIQGMVGLLIGAQIIEDSKAALLTFDLTGITPMEIISVKDDLGKTIWPETRNQQED